VRARFVVAPALTARAREAQEQRVALLCFSRHPTRGNGIESGAMSEHRYTTAERREHLLDLERALERLLAAIRETGEYTEHIRWFENALSRTRELLNTGFDQTALSALSRVIPRLFHLHKDWVPPLEMSLDGQHEVPPWFTTLEPLEEAVTACAQRLSAIGFY
jgi:hypothetical protein